MTAYEQRLINTERFYDKAMNLAESEAQEILPSYAPADTVHEKNIFLSFSCSLL